VARPARATLALILFALGCGPSAEAATSAVVEASQPEELSLHAIDWNAAKVDVGVVATVTESDEELVLFGSKGATRMAGGAVRSVLPGPSLWRDAATIPAADGVGRWTVGVSDAGKVLRVHGDELEDVSARWGLEKDKVRAVVGLDAGSVAFGFEGGLAIADGTRVTRYDGPSSGALAGGGGKLAWIDADVKVLTLADRRVRSYPIPRAVSVAIDPGGHVFVAAGKTLWAEGTDGLARRHVADVDIRGLSVAGSRVWMTIGAELGVVAGDGLALSKGANLASDARLRGTAKGDVWVLSSSIVRKFGGAAPSEALADWQTTVQPVYARVCAGCHGPGGTAGTDLSSLQGWRQHRDAIEKRVLVDKTMPPTGVAFSEADRAAVVAWLSRNLARRWAPGSGRRSTAPGARPSLLLMNGSARRRGT
jgi:mono/diheme cytochrome c family protein